MPAAALPRRRRRALGAALALALAAAGCGGGGDATDDAGATTTAPGGGETTASTTPLVPQDGGSLVYGIEADTSQPWTPQNALCAISCHMVMRTVFDSLALYDENGDAKPYLAESITPNEDFTEWSIVPRSGITFHDGTPFDAAAICDNITRHLGSVLTGRAMLDIADAADGGTGPIVSADGTACVVPMVRPWTHFDVVLTGQVGYMASPTWLASIESDPSAAARPVGTGPFVFESYEPGGSFVATKNPNYWRASEGLPHLDRIELRVFVDAQSRVNALLDGTIDAMHMANGTFIADLRTNDDIVMDELSDYGETAYVLLNVRPELNDGTPNPLADIRVRRALALAGDTESLSRDRLLGVEPPANGPFTPLQDGYLEDSGYPTFDLAAAIELVDEYEAENGPLVLSFNTTNDPYNEETNQLLAANIEAAGIEVNIRTVEQGSYILSAAQGDFQMLSWRNHGGADTDLQRLWWHSETGDLAEFPLALNFGGIDDEVIDENLDIIRTSDDDDERREAAENINRRFGEQVYNLWGTWPVWAIAHSPAVHGVRDFTFPDGTGTIDNNGIGGTHQLVQLWVEQ